MPSLIRVVLFTLLGLSPALLAQPVHFGDAFPLTNTRYGPAPANFAQLRSNGRDAFLFWSNGNDVRITRVGSSPAISTAILDTGTFDAIWTGTQFLVVGTRYVEGREPDVVGRVVDANGEPQGEPFTIAENARDPQLAFDGQSVLMLYRHASDRYGTPVASQRLHLLMLTPEGGATTSVKTIVGDGTALAVASNGESFLVMIAHVYEVRILLYDRAGQLLSEQVTTNGSGQSGTLATDGERYLAVTAEIGVGVNTRLLDADGHSLSTLTIPTDGFVYDSPNVVWDGSTWVIGYTEVDTLSYPLIDDSKAVRLAHAIHLNPAASAIVKRETQEGRMMSLLPAGERVFVSWTPGSHSGPATIGEFPLGEHPGTPVTFAAAEQELLTTASAGDAILIVWNEIGARSLRAGVRTRDGSWSEREIGSATTYALATSDGSEFALFRVSDNGFHLIRLASDLEQRGDPIPFDSTVNQMIWDGSAYVLTQRDSALRLSADGSLTPVGYVEGTIASNGSGFLDASLSTYILDPGGPLAYLHGRRLNRNFEALDPFASISTSKFLGTYYASRPAAAWDGRQYAVAWSTGTAVAAAHFSVVPGSEPVVYHVAAGSGFAPLVEAIDGSTAIFWSERTSLISQGFEDRIALLRQDGSVTEPFTLRRFTLKTNRPYRSAGAIAALRDGRIAYITPAAGEGTPHHGATRIVMRVGSPTPLPAKPDGPLMLIRNAPAGVVLEWTAPQQPVNGYRIEYAIDDGPWFEAEAWLNPDQRTFTFATTPGFRYAFRVRAFNDAGAGNYSAVVSRPGFGRRRSIR